MPTIPQNVCVLFSNAKPFLIEAEIPPRYNQDFEERYQQATGEKPVHDGHYQNQTNRRARELRIYFNSEELKTQLELNSYNVCDNVSYRPDYVFRVNNNELVWYLFEQCGFKVGINA